ncbi:hypothetical protein VRU48_13965 [Pedobacter sp. KR3-3]|uniref:Uncharacterized protein n=1 Tax=Pedobacter albus TaxID=3113905 RepID=A0ABU7I9T3_9SPHI|nr:hypothetical protein [Pedobacter sp. KR3-3]MEE1946225.1 hypothetical protein [Pedobacter sp. KR3-3]
MKKGLTVHYILFVAGLALAAVAAYLITTDPDENLNSKLIVVFAGAFVGISQFMIIKHKRKLK